MDKDYDKQSSDVMTQTANESWNCNADKDDKMELLHDSDVAFKDGHLTNSDDSHTREMLVGSPILSASPRSSEPYFDNFDNAITESLVDLNIMKSPDLPAHDRRKYYPTMKMFLPFRINKPAKDENPLPYAGFCSIMTFHWMSAYMWGIYRKGIMNVPTWACPSSESCSVNADRFTKAWKRELDERGADKSSLPRIIAKLFSKRIVFSFIVVITTLILTIIGPAFLIRWILEYLTLPHISIGYGIGLIAALIVTEFSRSVAMAVWWFINYQMAIRVRSGVLALIYRKIMTLRTLKDTAAGELINIFTNDGQRLFDGVCMVPFLPSILIILIFGIIYTAFLIGKWGLLGMFVYLLFFPIMIFVSRLTMKYRQRAIYITDKRVSLMSELLNSIKLIKMYAWEGSFLTRITDIRHNERGLLERAAYTQSVAVSSSYYIPIVSVTITFIAHTLDGNDLTAAQAFTMLAVLNSLRFSIGILPYCIKAFAEVVVTFRRIKKILVMDDINEYVVPVIDDTNVIEIKDFTAFWGVKDDQPTEEEVTDQAKDDSMAADRLLSNGLLSENVEAKSASYVLRDINVSVKKGELLAICGPISSGKSSLMNAILGKLIKLSGDLAVMGDIAYVPQQPWIMNTTVRDNILFGQSFNEDRYNTVIEACCLKQDFADFIAGDQTEIGERGLNLSGGQKQRLSLARAVYSSSDIVLLDDPLSAVDIHVGSHIFNECIKKTLSDRTVIFVTHQLQFSEKCDRVIFMKDGQIAEIGEPAELIQNGSEYASLVAMLDTHNREDYSGVADTDKEDYLVSSDEAEGNTLEKDSNQKPDGKLIFSEDIGQKKISWTTYRSYMQAAGSPLFLAIMFLLFTISISVQMYANWFLAHWINQGSGNTSIIVDNMTVISTSLTDHPSLSFYTKILGGLLVVIFLTSLIRGIIFMKMTLRASTGIHDTVLQRVIHRPMSFFDTTPTGRILNRFSKDMDEIDVFLPFRLETLIQNIFLVVASLVIIAIVSPWFLIALVPLTIFFLILNNMFMTSVRAIKQLDNTTRSPYISHIGASVHGISTIQAYRKTTEFINKFDELLDANSMPFFLFHLSSRWLAVRLDVICVILTAVTGILVVVTHEYITPAMAGLALTFAIQMTGMFQYTIRMIVEAEARFTSVERIQEYIQDVDSEDMRSVVHHTPDPQWPHEGQISFNDYTMRYRANLPDTLKSINFSVNPAEKIGIVGRTGSGKSSLGIALFRLVEAESGAIVIDGVKISDIDLSNLRSRLSIIPQDPTLFSGTIRYNLDPFSKYSDDEIWKTLERCRINNKILSLPDHLSAIVSENGDNFSAGERQLLCMARALLRNSKVIMLDEATASIDTETDALMQDTLKDAFSDCTILTIAHRIETVLSCDRILVMDDGKVLEFDAPEVLKSDVNSEFRKMLGATLKSSL